MVQASEEVVGEEGCEWFSEPGVGDAFDVDVDGFEDGLVEMSLRLVAGSLAGAAEVSRRGLVPSRPTGTSLLRYPAAFATPRGMRIWWRSG